jgi:hypothetical protein
MIGTIYIRNIPKTTRDMFHAACARKGTNMKFELIQLMKRFIQEQSQIGQQQPRRKK